MKEWFLKFWNDHGERIVFMLFALLLASLLYHFLPKLQEQVSAVFMMILGLIVNKIRSPKKEKPKKDETIDNQHS